MSNTSVHFLLICETEIERAKLISWQTAKFRAFTRVGQDNARQIFFAMLLPFLLLCKMTVRRLGHASEDF